MGQENEERVKKGKIGWLPSMLCTELDDVKREDRIDNDFRAMMELIKYARVGRETKRLVTLDWSRSIRLPPLSEFRKGSRKKSAFAAQGDYKPGRVKKRVPKRDDWPFSGAVI